MDEEQEGRKVLEDSYEREFSFCRCDTPTALLILFVIWSFFLIMVTIIITTSYQISNPTMHNTYVHPCDFHGVWQQDVQACECFDCAQGSRCELLLKPSSV